MRESNARLRSDLPLSDPAPTASTLYITADELKATLDLTGETFADADITLAVSSASRGVEQVCGRRFYADALATTIRYYTPDSGRLCRIDDLITLTELATGFVPDTFDQIWTLHTDFELEPLNATADGWPYTRIRAGLQHFTHQRRSVRVTGKFGWVTVPDEIVQATSLLASRLLRRAREAPFGVIGFAMEAGTSASVRLARQDPDVMALVGPYVRLLVR